MDTIYLLISYLCTAFAVVMTFVMLLAFRKPRRISIISSLLSAFLSLVMLPIFMALSGAQLNYSIGIPVLIFGLLVGFIRGQTMRMYYLGQEVVGQHSLLFLFGWGASLVLSQMLNLFGSAMLSGVGLMPLFLTTGTQVGIYGTLFLRRLMMKPSGAGGVD